MQTCALDVHSSRKTSRFSCKVALLGVGSQFSALTDNKRYGRTFDYVEGNHALVHHQSNGKKGPAEKPGCNSMDLGLPGCDWSVLHSLE